jgi:hypothetical protein
VPRPTGGASPASRAPQCRAGGSAWPAQRRRVRRARGAAPRRAYVAANCCSSQATAQHHAEPGARIAALKRRVGRTRRPARRFGGGAAARVRRRAGGCSPGAKQASRQLRATQCCARRDAPATPEDEEARDVHRLCRAHTAGKALRVARRQAALPAFPCATGCARARRGAHLFEPTFGALGAFTLCRRLRGAKRGAGRHHQRRRPPCSLAGVAAAFSASAASLGAAVGRRRRAQHHRARGRRRVPCAVRLQGGAGLLGSSHAQPARPRRARALRTPAWAAAARPVAPAAQRPRPRFTHRSGARARDNSSHLPACTFRAKLHG